jgi:hypothetical protein
MSDALQALTNLNDLASKKPVYTSGVASDVWTNFTKLIQNTSQPIVSTINQSVQGVYKDAVISISNPIKANTLDVQNKTGFVVNGLYDDIVNAINNLANGIIDIINSFQAYFASLVDQINSVIGAIGDWLNTTIANITAWLTTAVNNVINGLQTTIGNIITDVKQWLTDLYNNVYDQVKAVVKDVGDWITNTYNTIAAWIGGAIKSITDTYATVKQTVEDVFNNFLAWLAGIKNNIVAWWNNTLNNVSKFINEKVIPAFDSARLGAEGVVGMVKIIWGFISKGDYQGAFNALDQFMQGIGVPAPVKMLQSILSTIAYFWETIRMQFIPMEYNAQKQAVISLGLEPLDLGSATQAVYKGLMSAGEFTQNAILGGISSVKALKAIDANRPLPNPDEIRQSYLRGEIDLPYHDHLLKSYGFTDDNISILHKLYNLIPPITDLVHFADRWAWDDDIAKRFMYDTEFPDVVKDWCAKIGISSEWFTRYWRSHWQLPGLQDVFDMLHRLRQGVVNNPFTDSDLDAYLKTTPLPPYFHDKLKAISYNPFTRVDIRRMYKMGVLSKDDVTKAYQDLGYDLNKSKILTEFTIRYYAPDDQTQLDDFANQSRAAYSQGYRQHTISENEYRAFLKGLNYQDNDIEILVQIDNFRIQTDDKLFDNNIYRKDWQKILLNAYDRGLIHANELRPMLIDLGYDDSQVTLELSLSDYNRQLTIRNIVASKVHDQYVSYIIDNVGLHTILDQFNFTSEEIDKLQEEWDIERALRTKRPPLADLRKFWKAGLLTLEGYLDELRGEGYNEKYVAMYAQTLQGSGG